MITRLLAAVAAAIALTGCVAAGVPPTPAANAQLHPAASAYVDAVARRDLDALAAAFADDGVVVDVQRRITGRAAIREWAAREVIGGSLRVDGVTPLGGS